MFVGVGDESASLNIGIFKFVLIYLPMQVDPS